MKNKNHKNKIIFTLTLGLILTANLIVDKPWAQQKKQGKFIAISKNDIAVYSVDGIKWEKTTMPDEFWGGICYGNGKFVAIAEGSDVAAYSSDGINWKKSALPDKASTNTLCYGNSTFLIRLRSDNKFAYGSDGIKWNAAKLPYWAYDKVIYANNKFITEIGDHKILYSTDGKKWQITTLPVRIGCSTGICYGNGIFLIASNGFCDEEDKAVYSSDGINWTATKGVSVAGSMRSLFYGNGKFIALGEYSSGSAYSTDGKKWEEITFPDGAEWNTLYYGNGKFIAAAYSSNLVAYSTDAIKWKTAKLPIEAGLHCSGIFL